MTDLATSVKSAFSPDFNAAKTFFKALGKAHICFRLIPESDAAIEKNAASEKIREKKCNSTGRKYEFWNGSINLEGSLSQHLNEMPRKNREGYGIFAVINDGGHDARSINKIRAVFVDFDTPDQPEPDYKLKPSIVVNSSQGKHHAYWFTDEVKVDQFQPFQKELIKRYKTDPSVNDLPRVMRVPGFYHVKTDPQMVTMELNSESRYVMSDIEKLCSIPVSENLEHSIAETTVNSDPEITVNPSLAAYVKKIVDSPENEINDTVFKISYEMGLAEIEATEFDRAIATALMMRGREGDDHHLRTAFRGYNNGFESALKKAKRSVREFHLEVIEKTVEGRLKREAYGLIPYYKGVKANNLGLLYLPLSKETGLDLNKQLTQDKLELLLESPEYQANSLRDRFLEYADQHNDESVMAEIPNRMGVIAKMQKTYLSKFFIRLAARVLYPGCKADDVLILQGAPGVSKTNFWLTFLGDLSLYAELQPGDKLVDEQMKLNSVAIADMNEIESTFSKKDISALKAFTSTQFDMYRPPYGKAQELHPRHCVLVGTSNQRELLRDPTGNRRFHIVEVGKIDLAWFRENAPKILGYCVNLVKGIIESGGYDPMILPEELYLWWLNPDEEIEMKDHDKDFEQKDDIEEAVLNGAIHLGSSFTAAQLLASISGLEIRLTDRVMMSRINTILVKNQYKKGRREGVKTDHWYAPKIATDEPETVSDEPETVSNEPETASDESGKTYYKDVSMSEIQVNDDVTDKISRQVLRVIEIVGDTIKLGDINNGLPTATRNRSECVDARRSMSMVDF